MKIMYFILYKEEIMVMILFIDNIKGAIRATCQIKDL